jgi:FdhE protein
MPRPFPGERSATRELAELRALASRQPDLAAAAELHAELVATVRRVESRITTPSLDVPVELLKTRLTRGGPLASFGEFPVDWSEVRLLIRQITDVLRRMDVIDQASATRLHATGRDASLPERARTWYEAPLHLHDAPAEDDTDPMWPEVLQWALKPFLIRTADVLARRVPLDGWRRGRCPVCAAEPEFGALTATGEHLLLCPRCHARWPFDGGCPYCGNTETAELRTLTTADRVYRVTQCLKCERYLKLLDSSVAGRALLPFYDPVATLPLDAALMQES